jgi:tetratricopeptide (TPR) repeat protein
VCRHRGLIITGIAFLFLLVAGAGVSIWQAIRARDAERSAITARDNEAAQLRQANRSKSRAEAVLKFFQDKVLSAVRPNGQEGGVSREVTLREALEHAEPEISNSFGDEPLVEASIRNTLGVSYWYLGAHEQALRQQERALALRTRELGPEHPDTVGIMNDVAIILVSRGKYEEAQSLLEKVLKVKQQTLGPEDPSTLRTANNLATMMAQRGELEDGVKLLENTLRIQQRVDGPATIFTLRSEYNCAIMRRHLGELDRARASLEKTLETLRGTFGPDHQDSLRVMVALVDLMLEQGQTEQARTLCDQALEAQRRVLGPTHDETLATLVTLIDVVRQQGQLEVARKLAEEAVELNRRTLGPDHPQTLLAVIGLATVERDQGHSAEAKLAFEQAISKLRQTLAPRTPELQRALNAYAWMLATAEPPSARDPRKAVELASEVVKQTPRIREIWTTLGTARYRNGDWKETLDAIRKAQAVAPGQLNSINSFVLAMAYWQLDDKQAAREMYDGGLRSPSRGSQLQGGETERFRQEASVLLGISGSEPRPTGDSK